MPAQPVNTAIGSNPPPRANRPRRRRARPATGPAAGPWATVVVTCVALAAAVVLSAAGASFAAAPRGKAGGTEAPAKAKAPAPAAAKADAPAAPAAPAAAKPAGPRPAPVPVPADPKVLTDEQIGQSIEKGAKWLAAQFGADHKINGGKDDETHQGGLDALAVYALMQCGLALDKAPTLELKSPEMKVGSSRVDLQACKLEYSIVSPK